MGLFGKLFLLLSISTVIVEGCATHDNFMATFGKDVHLFGITKRGGASSPPKNLKEIQEVKSVSRMTDFDRAEESIFNKVENVEKAVLGAASSLLHDEVDVLFGNNHGATLHRPHNKVDSGKKEKDVKNVSMKTMKETSRKPNKHIKLDVEEDFFNIHREVADFMIE